MLKINNILLLLLLIFLGACSDDNDNGGSSVDLSQIKKVDDFVDPRDGHVYSCVQIGDQIWMAENLAYYLPEGAYGGCFTWNEEKLDLTSVSIPNQRWGEVARELLADPAYDWEAEGLDFEALEACIKKVAEMNLPQSPQMNKIKEQNPSFYLPFVERLEVAKLDYLPDVAASHAAEAERENDGYSKTYGYLYTLDAAKKSVPEGWRLPSDADWMKLEKALGISSDLEKMNAWRGNKQGDLLKTGGEALFNAKMAGCNAYVSSTNAMEYIKLRECAYFWASDEKEVEDLASDGGLVKEGIIREIAIYSSKIWRGVTRVENGYRGVTYSVRCVKDVK